MILSAEHDGRVDMMSVFQHCRRWFDVLTAPETDWVQIEVTGRCDAACVYCPRTRFPDSRRERNMKFATFLKLRPVMANSDLVYLQGWGEPLLHPDFFAMADTARRFGGRVGTCTNGMNVNEKVVDRILDCGLDIIAFSLAGTDRRQDRIRRGTEFAAVVNAIERLNERKLERGLDRPRIHLAYLLLASRIDDVRNLPDLAASLSIDQVVISTLDFVSDGSLLSESIFPESRVEFSRFRTILDEVVKRGASQGVAVYYYLGRPGYAAAECPENPGRALFISVDGDVSPCVFHGLPHGVDEVNAVGDTKSRPSLVFGNLTSASAGAVWNKRDYQRWRRDIAAGDFGRCGTCRKRHLIRGGGT